MKLKRIIAIAIIIALSLVSFGQVKHYELAGPLPPPASTTGKS